MWNTLKESGKRVILMSLFIKTFSLDLQQFARVNSTYEHNNSEFSLTKHCNHNISIAIDSSNDSFFQISKVSHINQFLQLGIVIVSLVDKWISIEEQLIYRTLELWMEYQLGFLFNLHIVATGKPLQISVSV